MIGEDSGKVREDASQPGGSAEWKEVEVAVIGKFSQRGVHMVVW